MKILNFRLKILVLLLLTIIVSCDSNKKKIKADLSFRSIVFTTAYGADTKNYDRVIKEVDSNVNSYNKNDSVNYNTYKLNQHILKLHKLGLLKLPNAYLHFGSDSIMEVHISEREYEKIKNFRQIDLQKENKKVVIELDVEEIDDGIYFSDNIRSVEKIEGKSRSNIFKKE